MAAVAPEVTRLAAGDFSVLAARFGAAGFVVDTGTPGMVSIKLASAAPRASVLLSVGVHGDETGPIELLAHLLESLSLAPQELAMDLMVCVGNIDAITAGKRFIDADLNRMFRPERGTLASAAEAARADQMIAATAAFFELAGLERWHLDLHTAIRPSLYPAFAIVPELIDEQARGTLTGWLGHAGIGAIIMNRESAGTYSYYSAQHHQAAGSTVELGRVGELGKNDLGQFAAASAALDDLLRGRVAGAAPVVPQVFRVAQQIIKRSDAFRMAFGADTPNFTALPRGAEIASDGEARYTVAHDEEFVVFPNPDVRVGLRAALMVVRA